MNERLSSIESSEAEPQYDISQERSLGNKALLSLVTENEQEQVVPTKESIKRPGGDVYAQDQPEYAPYISQATAIIKRAIWGDMSSLDRIPNAEIRGALIAHIETFDGQLPSSEEIEKMISVACGGLAPTTTDRIAA